MIQDKPNILLIQADQLKPQVLKPYGGVADTPYLDSLVDLSVNIGYSRLPRSEGAYRWVH